MNKIKETDTIYEIENYGVVRDYGIHLALSITNRISSFFDYILLEWSTKTKNYL